MRTWKLIFRAKSSSNSELMPRGIRKDISLIGKIQNSYAINLYGVRLLGFEFTYDSEDFNHICRLIKILERRYMITLFEFSEKEPSPCKDGVKVKIGSKPAFEVA